MVRPKMFKNCYVTSVRLDEQMHLQLKEIASLETSLSGKMVTVQDLIRNSLRFTYDDGERLREVFRRTKEHINKKFRFAKKSLSSKIK